MQQQYLTRDEMEARREQAALCLSAGAAQVQIARQFGVSRAAASRWAHQVATGASMRKKHPSGRPARVTPEQWRAVYDSMPAKYWTCYRFTAAIFERLGVHYSADHVGKRLKMLRKEKETHA